jgi:hypothetical protein
MPLWGTTKHENRLQNVAKFSILSQKGSRSV